MRRGSLILEDLPYGDDQIFSSVITPLTVLKEVSLLLFFSLQAKDLCLQVFARYPEFSNCSDLSSFEVLSNPEYCGKMKVLDKLLRMFRREHCKVLLFSRSTQVCF